MSRKLEAWLHDGLTDLVGALERERTADEARAAVARERESDAAAEFGKAITAAAGSSAPAEVEEGEEGT